MKIDDVNKTENIYSTIKALVEIQWAQKLLTQASITLRTFKGEMGIDAMDALNAVDHFRIKTEELLDEIRKSSFNKNEQISLAADYIKQGKIIPAIKAIRDISSLSLADAKRIIDNAAILKTKKERVKFIKEALCK